MSLFASEKPTPPMDQHLRVPWAEKMRPDSLDTFFGQEHLLGHEKPLRRIIEAGSPVSMIFWGPPGTGKTTLARIIARHSNAQFMEYSAVLSGVKEIREVVQYARRLKQMNQQDTILFVDEIHRFNKAQQDAFLPHVENGTIVLIGATTENPSFEVIPALISRCRIFVLQSLSEEYILRILTRAVDTLIPAISERQITVEEEVLPFLADYCGGDARVALNTLEFGVQYLLLESGETPNLTLKIIAQVLNQKLGRYDKSGEEHFNIISAFHKSVRGSDPDAALYWMSRMLSGGEHPMYIARRMIRIASEDVGMADPAALRLAIAAAEAYQMLGSPEGDLALAHCAVYLATAPKSNRIYTAFKAAMTLAEETATLPVPMNIRNAPTRLMKDQGYGEGYQYDHDVPGAHAGQEFLPEDIRHRTFYQPSRYGFEQEIQKRIQWWQKRKRTKHTSK